ncbi:MAG: hypothetical protein HY817_04455 [Candidatus Abawacabacteria bacterium]|nr:hypothetical protein [Candidatus Abawacabacteria bacterium]
MSDLAAISHIIGDDLITSYMRRFEIKRNVTQAENSTYIQNAAKYLTGLFDDYIVDHLTDQDVTILIGMRLARAPQAEIMKFLQEKIPDLSQQLEHVFQQFLAKENTVF